MLVPLCIVFVVSLHKYLPILSFGLHLKYNCAMQSFKCIFNNNNNNIPDYINIIIIIKITIGVIFFKLTSLLAKTLSA